MGPSKDFPGSQNYPFYRHDASFLLPKRLIQAKAVEELYVVSFYADTYHSKCPVFGSDYSETVPARVL